MSSVPDRAVAVEIDDDVKLEELGYIPSFKREFSNLATISFAFSIMGLCSSVATTFNTPLSLGGPSSVTWCWILGATMCFTLGSSIAEIVSAFPTCGGLYTASAQLCPRKHRPIVGWVVGWLNILGQVAGVSSTEYGLAGMIWGAVYIAKDGKVDISAGKVVGLFAGLMVFHGLLNCLSTKYLAKLTRGFVFINLGATCIIIIVLLATTPRNEMHSASYVFGTEGFINGTGGWPSGISFLLGLLSVQWTMTDYDASAHISEEVKRAAYAAPAAIFIAVIGTGLLGWLFNIVLVLCSGPFNDLPGPSGNAVLQIMTLRIGRPGALFLWALVCLTAFFVVQTALQACSRTVYAFSRDKGLPDRGYFAVMNNYTGTPIRAIWITTLAAILPGLLAFASLVAANAIFSLTAIALDLSYIIPIFLRRVYAKHPDVKFVPGPFYMGNGWLGLACNTTCITWTLFVAVLFSLPTNLPVDKDTMNYASVITVGVIALSLLWYFSSARAHYKGPVSYTDGHGEPTKGSTEDRSEKENTDATVE
ncbi:APC amino acid permease [Thelephora ganbajun]|uniref:APC amino acid permease n=1 Tax=Thelephora ganbajun TaxID=370292 RepID=A0ACB6ZJE0_THEGA|nr:APC amino acid permease [Thelephora ganbajun]